MKLKLLLVTLLISAFSWGQATLPLSRTAWGTTPTGWTDNGTNRTTSYACSGNDGGSTQATGKYYKVWFSGIPSQLTYSIKGSNPTTGSFKVQESPDGTTWSDVMAYTTISGSSCINESKSLLSTSRYVQFIYVTKTSGNVDIDDVGITAAGSYCASSGTTTYNTSVTNVTLNTINNTTAKPSGYSDYTGTQSTNLQQGVTYPLSMKINTDGNYTVLAFAWIDFNHDGDFLDAGEAFGMGSATNTASGLTNVSPLSITIPLTATLGATRMRVIATYNGDSSPCLTGFDGEVEDYTVVITAACTPTQTVSSFTPTSGPSGTDVTITGSGFTAGTTVKFNGNSATVVFVNSTTLIATVPSGVTTGVITITEGGCPVYTSSNFTQITKSGVCTSGNNLNDLIISEAYDSLAGNSWYMELYNPTASPIDLDAVGADYKLVRYGDIGLTTGIRTVNISGIVAPGGVYLADLGTDSSCAGLTFNYVAKANGINENDEIRLTKNDVTVDIVYCPNEKGYSILRNSSASGPSATFNAADWTTNSNESCSNLGLVSFTSNSILPSLSASPTDVNACGKSASFSVSATPINSGTLSYQWYYNNAVATGWTAVSSNSFAGVVCSGFAASTLNLAGTVSLYDGYQFYCQVTENGTCSIASDAAQLKINSTTWNGSAWSNGTPDLTKVAIINGTYSTISNGDIDACSLIVNSSYTATINSGRYFNILNDLTVNGTLTIQNNGSLVQINDDGIDTGSISMDRTVNVHKSDYVYWSSPVQGFNVGSISPTTPSWYVYKWDPIVTNSNAGQGNWVLATGAMDVARGYAVKSPNSFTDASTQPLTATFNAGKPNNGIITASISRGSYTGTNYPGTNGTIITNNDDNWNLIGNPYPSSIKVTDFLSSNTNIEGAIRLWTHGTPPSSSVPSPFYATYQSNYSPNDYITHNGTGTVSGPTGFNGYIAAAQGFYILMNDGASTTQSVTFNNAMRNKAYNNSQFYKISTMNSNNSSSEKHRIWIDLVDSNNQSVRTLVGYITGATLSRDRIFDAYTSIGSAKNIYSIVDGVNMTIQGRPVPFDVNDQVVLGINIPSTGNFKIAIAAVDGLFENNHDIYLEDKELNIIHDLRQSSYDFFSNSGNFNNRFILRYTNSSLFTLNFDSIDTNVIVATPSKSKISIKSALEKINSVVVYDMLGREIVSENNVSENLITFTNITSKNQVLLVKIKLENGQTLTRKVFL